MHHDRRDPKLNLDKADGALRWADPKPDTKRGTGPEFKTGLPPQVEHFGGST